LKNRVEYILFILLIKFFNLLGLNFARRTASIFTFIFFYIFPLRKETVIENLKIAFPAKPDSEIITIAKNCYKSFIITLVEIACVPYLNDEQTKQLSSAPDLDKILEMYNQKKGLILLTAHFGNWELGAISLALKMNVSIRVVGKSQRNNYVNDWINMMRESHGNKVTQLGVSIKNVYRELLDKNVVGMVGDQRGPREGIRINYFGKQTAMYPGTAQMAIKTGAPIAVCIAVRQPDYKYLIASEIIEPDKLTGTDEEKILEINQRYMNILESVVRKNPEQWFWMHKIWKY